ncbi:Probable aquaporin NIP4-2 [Linum grandiflorum]
MGHHRHQIPLSSGECSPKASIVTEPQSSIEEGKASMNNIAVISQLTSSTVDDVSFASSSTIHAHKIIAELVGSYVIILIGCASIMVNKKGEISMVGVGAAWGLAVMVMIYTLGHISGAHFNPAITLALASSCRFSWKQVPGYVGAQVGGSVLAVLSVKVMFNHENVDIKGLTTTRLKGSLTCLQGLLWELLISFILMLTIFGVAVDTRAVNELSGISIGAAVLFNVMIAGNMTGASMNPARSIGAALVNREFENLWIYVVGPVVGMLTATAIYNVLLTDHNSHKKNIINANERV